MPRRISLEPHLTTQELFKKFKSARQPVERDRYQVLWLLSKGKTSQEVAEVTRFHTRGVRTLVKRYNEGGPEAMMDRRRHNKGRAARLNAEQRKMLEQTLSQDPPEGGVWDSVKVAAWIEQQTGSPTSKQLGWDYLKRFEHVLPVPRRRYAKRNKQAQRPPQSPPSDPS